MSKTVAELKKMFFDARDFNTGRMDEYKENLAYYEMEEDQLPQNQVEKPWVLNINAPYAADAINLRAASLFSSDYVGELEPLSPEDVDKVETLNKVYHNFWYEANMDKFINNSIREAMIIRESYIHVIFEDKLNGGSNRKKQGRLVPYNVNTASLYIDPKALSLRTADYLVVVERLSKREFKFEYNKDIDKNGNAVASTLQPNERGEIYAGNDYSTNQDDVLTKLTFYVKEDDKIMKYVVVENDIVDEGELPISVFPIAQLRWEKKLQSPYGISLMDRILALQKSINAIESATTTTALAFASPSYVVRADSGVNPSHVAAMAGSPGVVFRAHGDPKTAIVPFSNGSIDVNLLTTKQDNKDALYKLAGITPEFMGDLGTSGNTSKGSDAAINRAKVIEQFFLDNLEEFIEDLTYIFVEFITKAFKGETIYSRGARKSDGTYDFKQYNISDDADSLDYQFSINMDVKTPYSKEVFKGLLKDLYQYERQYDSPVKVVNVLDILKNYNLPNVDELVERYKQLTVRDTESKSQIVAQWTMLCAQHGIDGNVIVQGITEIINGAETPTVDAVTKQIEMQIMAQEKQQVMADQTLAAQQMRVEQKQRESDLAAVNQSINGNEVIQNNTAAPMGDETL